MSRDKNEKNCLIGRRLKEERERIELSQEEFGLRIDTTKRTVVNWETGNSSPNVADLILMGYQIGVDTNYIVSGRRTPLGIAEGTATYSPAEHAAAAIRSLKLTEDDAELVTAMAKRLAKT